MLEENIYENFLKGKQILTQGVGINEFVMPKKLFDFQKSIVQWALKKGRCAGILGRYRLFYRRIY